MEGLEAFQTSFKRRSRRRMRRKKRGMMTMSKRWRKEEVRYSGGHVVHVVQEGMLVKISLSPFSHLPPSPCSSCFKVIFTKKKF